MKGLVSTVLIIAIVIVLIWWVVRWSTQTSTVILSGPLCVDSLDCPKGYNQNPPIIKQNNTLSGNAASSNYTISLWYYVTQWTITQHEKVLFTRLNSGSGSMGGPMIALGSTENNLLVQVACLDTSGKSLASANTCTADKEGVNTHSCSVDNVPIQRWVNVLVSVYGRTLDIYVDGKLTKTCLLPGIAIAEGDGICVVAPSDGSFNQMPTSTNKSNSKSTDASKCVTASASADSKNTSNSTTSQCANYKAAQNLTFSSSSFPGYIDNVRYWDSATNPQQAYNIYKDGPSGGGFGTNFFDDYYMEVGFYDKGTNEFSFRI